MTSPCTNWTNETLSAVLVNHVTNLVAHFGDRCYSWDVVNEALSDSPAGAWSSNIWYDTIGPEYFFLAFQAAAHAVAANNLSVKLYYNDYNIEYVGDKSAAAQALVAQLQERGIQIDGVGFESHFIVGDTPSQADQEANMKAFVALGVDVAVTELDVRLDLPANATTETQQVSDYYSTVAACANVARCVGITVWDFDGKFACQKQRGMLLYVSGGRATREVNLIANKWWVCFDDRHILVDSHHLFGPRVWRFVLAAGRRQHAARQEGGV